VNAVERRLQIGLTCLAIGLGLPACSSENGKGFITGPLNIPACQYGEDKKPLAPDPKQLANVNLPECEQYKDLVQDVPLCAAWDHFVAEPYDSTSVRYPANQLNIRMQNISGGWEFADTIFFWVYDSWEVARCVRGRMNDDGTPDWNTEECDRSPGVLGPDGEGRMRIGTEGELVTSHLVLQYLCPGASISATGIGTCEGGSCPDVSLCPGRGSWISFSQFGSFPADPNEEIARTDDFKVKKGDPVAASAFHVELCDSNTVDDIQDHRLPVTKPAIIGTLEGHFSFTMQPNFR